MGCASSKQHEIFLDQNGQAIAVSKRPQWNEKRVGRKGRPHTQKPHGPPSPVVTDPAPWVAKTRPVLSEVEGAPNVLNDGQMKQTS
ncbi:hypothetical protein BDW22DRAFT_1349744 [Trametopsis cervina]|nr:hypothetical protein BDW22DRAFT_1349744 [Trametopsis cervina]